MTHEERWKQFCAETGIGTATFYREPFLRHLREVEAEAIKGLVTPDPNRQWVKCSERMPTEKDADCEGRVFWLVIDRATGDASISRDEWFAHRQLCNSWMPTGLVRPEPPKE